MMTMLCGTRRFAAGCAATAMILGAAAVPALGSDKLLVSSFSGNRVQRYSATSAKLIDFMSGGGALVNPLGMTIGPDGALYVTSEGTDQVLRLNRHTGALIGVFVGDDPATVGIDESGGLDNPAAVVFGPDGKLYVSSFETDAILRYDGATGAFLDVFVPSGSGGLDGPDAGMTFGPGGDLFVPSFWSNAVLRYSGADGSPLPAFVPAGAGGLSRPRTVLFRPGDGHALVTSEGGNAVLLFDGATGAPMGTLISGIPSPTGIAYGPDGNVYVASLGLATVRRYQPDGTFIGTFATGIPTVTYLMFSNDRAPDFTEQAQFGSSATIGVAWGDGDGDGRLDLAVANVNAQNQLFVNGGGGSFSEQAQFGAGSFALSWADYDNDGDLDMAAGNTSNTQNRLYVNQGDGTFVDQAQFGALTTTSVAWGDFDNDGDVDLAVGNGILGVAQANGLYVNNGDGTFTTRAEFGEGQTDSIAWGDFDNDGDLDLAVGNGGFGFVGQNYLYVNNGDGSFTQREEFGLGDTASVAWGDANNDGWLDLAVGNWNNGPNPLYLNNRDGTFSQRLAFGARDTNTVAWGDVDNDGDLDLAVGNGDFQSADQNYVYVNNGDATFVELAAFGLGSTDGIAFGDFDGDGDVDAAVGNEHSPPQNYLYVNNANDANYLVLRLIGHFHDLGAGYSNRDAIGARVSVFAPDHLCDPAYLIGHRQIDATGGFTSQNSLAAEFGVLGHTTVDVRIDWPGSGGTAITHELHGVAVAQHLTVHETVNVPGLDCNGNSISDACDIAGGESVDCNANGTPDQCDIADTTSADCSTNGIPDECEPDCNGNTVADSCDILAATSQDCSGNGVPDECEPDCNGNTVADSCDILAATSQDCSGNGVPDECEPDCNNNSTADSCDIFNTTSSDCNANAVPDECDVALGSSADVNHNGVPDECECAPFTTPIAQTILNAAGAEVISAKNRFLSFSAGEPGVMQAVRITFVTLPGAFSVLNGTSAWVDVPFVVSELPGKGLSDPVGADPSLRAARLKTTPAFADWSTLGVVHVFDERIIPSRRLPGQPLEPAVYHVQLANQACDLGAPESYSPALSITNARWGDVAALQAGEFRTPDGSVDVTSDVLAVLAKFSNAAGAPIKARAEMVGTGAGGPQAAITGKIDISDVLAVLGAFSGGSYPFPPPP